MDLYITDLDKTFRELGIGDMSIGKYVKSHVKKIYYRLFKLEAIFEKKNYEEFEKYIKKTNIQEQEKNIPVLSKFLFKSMYVSFNSMSL